LELINLFGTSSAGYIDVIQDKITDQSHVDKTFILHLHSVKLEFQN